MLCTSAPPPFIFCMKRGQPPCNGCHSIILQVYKFYNSILYKLLKKYFSKLLVDHVSVFPYRLAEKHKHKNGKANRMPPKKAMVPAQNIRSCTLFVLHFSQKNIKCSTNCLFCTAFLQKIAKMQYTNPYNFAARRKSPTHS